MSAKERKPHSTMYRVLQEIKHANSFETGLLKFAGDQLSAAMRYPVTFGGHRMSQSELAASLTAQGLDTSRQTIGRIQEGAETTFLRMAAIANFLDVSMEFFNPNLVNFRIIDQLLDLDNTDLATHLRRQILVVADSLDDTLINDLTSLAGQLATTDGQPVELDGLYPDRELTPEAHRLLLKLLHLDQLLHYSPHRRLLAASLLLDDPADLHNLFTYAQHKAQEVQMRARLGVD